ncbi:MAG: histidine phosphatase family protein [Acidobacteriota bacterium]
MGLLTGLAVLAPPAVEALDTVYVTRHAQKDRTWSGAGDLRPLSPKGARCAAALAERLADAEVSVVVSSETARTLSTAGAVARGTSATVVGDDRSIAPSAAWGESLRATYADDRAILLVGHSDTVDDLVLALRPGAVECFETLGLASPEIPETQFGDLWRIDLGTPEGARGCGIVRQRIEAAQDDCSTP